MKKVIYILIITIGIFGCKKESGEDTPPEIKNEAPTVPVLSAPTNKQLCIDEEVVFSWQKSTDKEGDKVTYVLEIAPKSDFLNILHTFNLKEVQKTMSLKKGILYFWRVKAIDSKGEHSNYSSVYQFYTEGDAVKNHLPFAPTLVAPALNKKVEKEEVTLQWTASDIDKDALTYTVYLGTKNPPTKTVAVAISKTSKKVSLTANTHYFWKVEVKDAKGGITKGQVWMFSK